MHRFVLACAALILLSAAAPSWAAVCNSSTPNCPGADCTQLGATQMSADSANIIACVLKNGDSTKKNCPSGGGCAWKNMSNEGATSEPPKGTLCGFVNGYVASGRTLVVTSPVYVLSGPYGINELCEGQSIIRDSWGHVGCPQGYSLGGFKTGSNTTCSAIACAAEVFCVKN